MVIVVEVRGGCVQDIYAQVKPHEASPQVVLLDWDADTERDEADSAAVPFTPSPMTKLSPEGKAALAEALLQVA